MPYQEKTKSYGHQLKARDKARGRRGFAYLMEMGTGKTKTAIDELGEQFEEREAEQALILAPNGVYSNWSLREIPTHMPEHLLDRTKIHLWDGGNTVREKNAIKDLMAETDRHGILNMNLEAIGSSDKAWQLALDFINRRPTAIIIDESTRIKNPDAIVTKSAMRYRDRSVSRRILTGYPNPNSPMDLYSQMDFCVPQCLGTNFYSFRHKYAVTEKVQVGWIPQKNGPPKPKLATIIKHYQNLKELSSRLDQHSFRALKRDCLDLPQENYRTRDVELTNEQWRIYRDMTNLATAAINAHGDFVTATMIITQMLRLHQITCGFVTTDDGREVGIKSNRLKEMEAEIEEMGDRPGIIWCTYHFNIREVVELIKKMKGDRAVVEYHGHVSRADCDIAIDRFQGGDANWFVATESKGGFGITLTRSADDFYFSNTYNLEHRLQAEARTHRSGQTQNVTHTDLISRGTVDEKMIQALRKKIDIGDAVLNDGYRKWVM